ncbi:hypothetical protein [Halomarina oriensis]|uniref:Uncharacterized protein n=1 Tax=Halomarina oriensis TaxID=671145 RepID=A0A6B0GHP4_9EURY|nr:hypothetical protein [Halomarina oriensis]MWG34382.1 hypothetical protein [Halomarina oriensis]
MNVAPYDHVRVTGDESGVGDDTLAPATYRVVGIGDEHVTLLEVADTTGQRVHTGRVERVSHAVFDAAKAVDGPDSGGPLARVRSVVEGFALTLRYAPRRIAGRPIQTLLGVVLVVAEALGPATVGVSESVLTVAGVFGVLALTAAALDMP